MYKATLDFDLIDYVHVFGETEGVDAVISIQVDDTEIGTLQGSEEYAQYDVTGYSGKKQLRVRIKNDNVGASQEIKYFHMWTVEA